MKRQRKKSGVYDLKKLRSASGVILTDFSFSLSSLAVLSWLSYKFGRSLNRRRWLSFKAK
jgi:hypothetical protein